MSLQYAFSSWREAQDRAVAEMQSETYRYWGWAKVFKDPETNEWIASIA